MSIRNGPTYAYDLFKANMEKDKEQFQKDLQVMDNTDQIELVKQFAEKLTFAKNYTDLLKKKEEFLKQIADKDFKQFTQIELAEKVQEYEKKAADEYKNADDLLKAKFTNIKTKAEREALLADLTERKGIIDALLKNTLAERAKRIHKSAPDQSKPGMLSHIENQNHYNPESVAFSMLITDILYLTRIAFSVEYIIQCIQYTQALDEGRAYQGEVIYAVDKKGNPDYNKPLNAPTREQILNYGLVPPPNYVDSLKKELAGYIEEILGPGYLTADLRVLLHNTSATARPNGPGEDEEGIAKSRLANQAAENAKKAALVPRPGH